MEKKSFRTKTLVVTALFAALTMIATLFLKFPLALGYVHLGDAFVFLSGFMLGPFWGAAAAGVGSALADVAGGYAIYAPITAIVKAVMALLGAFLGKKLVKIVKKELFAETIAGIVGTCVLTLGYFFYETLLYSIGAAVANVLWNLLQGGVGVLISVSLMRLPIMKKMKKNILNF